MGLQKLQMALLVPDDSLLYFSQPKHSLYPAQVNIFSVISAAILCFVYFRWRCDCSLAKAVIIVFALCSMALNFSFDLITFATGETLPLADVGCPIFTVKLQCCNSTSAGQLQCISTDPCVFNYEVLEQEEP